MDKLVYITKGQDTFESILLGAIGGANEAEGASKYRLVNSERELDNFLAAKGVTKDCWGRVGDHFAGLFGEPDPLPSLTLGGQSEEMESSEQSDRAGANENPFPETEIDEMRAVRDTALVRYIAEMERKAEMQEKMNARSGGSGGNDR